MITEIIRKHTFPLAVNFNHQRKFTFGGKYIFSNIPKNNVEQIILAGTSNGHTPDRAESFEQQPWRESFEQ